MYSSPSYPLRLLRHMLELIFLFGGELSCRTQQKSTLQEKVGSCNPSFQCSILVWLCASYCWPNWRLVVGVTTRTGMQSPPSHPQHSSTTWAILKSDGQQPIPKDGHQPVSEKEIYLSIYFLSIYIYLFVDFFCAIPIDKKWRDLDSNGRSDRIQLPRKKHL